MPNLLSKLTGSEQARLLEEVNYMNTTTSTIAMLSIDGYAA